MKISLEDELAWSKGFLMCALLFTLEAAAVAPGGILDYRRYEEGSLMNNVSNIAMVVNYCAFRSPFEVLTNFNPQNREYFFD